MTHSHHNASNDAPVGVLDSEIGGLSVLREMNAVADIKLVYIVAVLASAILSSCVPSPKEIEQIAIEEFSDQIEISATVLPETPVHTSTVPAKVVTPALLTPVITHKPAVQRAEESSDQIETSATVLPETPVHTSTVPAKVVTPALLTPVITHKPIAQRSTDIVASYWTLVNRRDYKSAWRLLSNGFQQRKHKGDYAHYENTYQEMNICGVEAINIETVAEHDRSAIVSAHMSYLTGSGCDDQRDFVFDFTLTRESRDTAWKIDIVSPVANRDILLGVAAKCDDAMAAVVPSSLNVRSGPGAGRSGEALYPIQSYLQKYECVTATATNSGYSWVRISNTPRAGAEDGWVAVSFLEFGAAHPEPDRLPVVAEPTPPPTDLPTSVDTLKPIGVKHLGNADHVCYDIQGSSGPQLASQMDRLGPYDSDGNKTWAVASLQFVISGGTCYSDGTVDLSDVVVSLQSTITMPCWRPPPATSPTEISKFDGFMYLIARHELRHVEIAWQWARILEKQLKDANTCDQATLNAVYNQVWSNEEAAQDAFHASPEGQIIPYP